MVTAWSPFFSYFDQKSSNQTLKGATAKTGKKLNEVFWLYGHSRLKQVFVFLFANTQFTNGFHLPTELSEKNVSTDLSNRTTASRPTSKKMDRDAAGRELLMARFD